MNRKTALFVGLATVILILDQVTKFWVYNNIAYGSGEIDIIPGFFSLVHAQNPGAAFGILRDSPYRHWLFGVFTVIAVGIIVDLVRKLPSTERFITGTLALILSGAVGNAIDRVHKGTVTDFLKVYTDSPSLKPWLIRNLGTNEWPSFNVADSALVVGVCLFLAHYLFIEDPEEIIKRGNAAPPGTAPPEGSAGLPAPAEGTGEA